MIHIFIGTKAQFIKTFPIMKELTARDIPYNFIEVGQHAAHIDNLLREFDLQEPDIHLRASKNDIETLMQAICWTRETLMRILSSKANIVNTVFKGKAKGICLIHGDTLTTLFSLLYAKRCNIPVAHVEAGLRSFNLLNPFPEEIIRLLTMRFSDILFSPSSWAMENLKRMGYEQKSIDIGGNTIFDSIRFARTLYGDHSKPAEPYVVVTIHRFESIYSSFRMNLITSFIEKISNRYKVLFIIHNPTYIQLNKYNLLKRLKESNSIDLLPLQPYMKFIYLLSGADFVVTDGGSIQEECYILNTPCFIMRSKTERQDGLGQNAFIVGFSNCDFDECMRILPYLKNNNIFDEEIKPSSHIVDFLQNYLEAHA